MKNRARTDVVVNGAGPVGMFAALSLRKQELEVEVFDSSPGPGSHSYALALHPDSLSLMEEFGLLEDFKGRMFPLRKIAIHRGRDQLSGLDLASIAGLEHPFVAVFPQAELERVLLEGLRRAGVPVRWNHRLSAVEDTGRFVRGVVAELEERSLGYAIGHGERFVRKNHEFETGFVIGADGHDSFVRRALEIPFPEVGPAEKFAVFEARGKGGDDETMRILAADDGKTSVRWPLGPDTWRWSFQVGEAFSVAEEWREKDSDLVQFVKRMPYPALDREQLQLLIRERAPWCDDVAENLYWRLLIRFEKRLVERFGKGRIWLAGDAAHLAGPIGVQSMNVGLREAHDLAGRMVGMIEGKVSLDIFEEYNRERLDEWRFLLGLTGTVRASLGADPRSASLASGLRGWLPASGYRLATLAHRLGFEIDDMPMAAGLLKDDILSGAGFQKSP